MLNYLLKATQAIIPIDMFSEFMNLFGVGASGKKLILSSFPTLQQFFELIAITFFSLNFMTFWIVINVVNPITASHAADVSTTFFIKSHNLILMMMFL